MIFMALGYLIVMVVGLVATAAILSLLAVPFRIIRWLRSTPAQRARRRARRRPM